MTREEASSVLDDYDVNFDGHTAEEIAEAFDVAFRALEQESCEDAVSVASVFEIMENLMSIPYDFDRSITEKDVSESMDKIRALPRVTPQEPILEKDGTLIVTTEHCEKVGRVLVQYGTNGTLFYQDQELRKGHWIEHPHECGINWEYPMYECSECHEWAEDDSDFCPNCGANMREVKE